jgi:hypothetical protein
MLFPFFFGPLFTMPSPMPGLDCLQDLVVALLFKLLSSIAKGACLGIKLPVARHGLCLAWTCVQAISFQFSGQYLPGLLLQNAVGADPESWLRYADAEALCSPPDRRP